MDKDLLLFLGYARADYNQTKLILDLYNNFEDLKEDKMSLILKANTKLYEKLNKRIDKFDSSSYKEYLWKKNIRYVDLDDKAYPRNLRYIEDPPFLLYYIGNLTEDFNESIAVVGARKCSQYGDYACKKICRELCDYNIPIISGLALGVDKISHSVCLENNNHTLAVLGCGIDKIYPKSNRRVFESMYTNEKAVIVSEYPPGTEPLPFNFPFRNRIIAGISLATVVVEAKDHSGTLITASHAINQGKDVFAIPGNINSVYSQGTNQLIKDGAFLLTDVKDIITQIKEFQDKYIQKPNIDIDLDELEEKLINLISESPKSPDELTLLTREDISNVLMKLTKLELLGLITEIGSKYSLR
ncbi:MAG: DNA-processing protein DprA [Finegoldia sp.]|nr:DNA-processing protein DprA [Finegoldia sp.]